LFLVSFRSVLLLFACRFLASCHITAHAFSPKR
jgi:hypothetical protein